MTKIDSERKYWILSRPSILLYIHWSSRLGKIIFRDIHQLIVMTIFRKRSNWGCQPVNWSRFEYWNDFSLFYEMNHREQIALIPSTKVFHNSMWHFVWTYLVQSTSQSIYIYMKIVCWYFFSIQFPHHCMMPNNAVAKYDPTTLSCLTKRSE